MTLKGRLFTIAIVFFAYYWYAYIKQGPVYESNKSLEGKTVLLTGGNAGIGKATAIEVAKRNGRLIIASRNVAKTVAAKEEIVKLTGNDNIKIMKLDLEDFDSVRTFAEEIISTEEHIDYLVNNAGVLFMDGLTSLGYGRVFTINHLGHFLLTNLLLDKLKTQSSTRPVRIINVSSGAYKLGKLDDWDIVKKDPEGLMDNFVVYSTSKLANVYFTSELHNRLKSFDITTYSLHPGAIYSDIGLNVPGMANWIFKTLEVLVARSAYHGTQTTMYTMLDDGIVEHSGKYFAECAMEELLPHATNASVGKELWDRSLKMVGLE